jgi:hypothetical protein
MLRELALLASIVVATISLAGCVTVSEVLTARELACEETPEDLCLRIADLADPALGGAPGEDGPRHARTTTTVRVAPADCADLDRGLPATRCWRVDGIYIDGYADIRLTDPIEATEFSERVYQRPDGGLVVWR